MARVDWTKRPLGAARPALRDDASRLARLLQDKNQPAHVVDQQCRVVERAIAAFRENER